jgi:hypothetical protein
VQYIELAASWVNAAAVAQDHNRCYGPSPSALSDNALTGTIPTEMRRLEELRLSATSLAGPFPSELAGTVAGLDVARAARHAADASSWRRRRRSRVST